MQKDAIPAHVIDTLTGTVRRQTAPEIDHRRPVIGLLDQPPELAAHLRACLAAHWPDACVRHLDAAANLRDLWLVWASPAGARAIATELERAAPLAWLLIVGSDPGPAEWTQVAEHVADTETACGRVAGLLRILAAHREAACAALVKQRVAEQLGRDYPAAAIRAAGLEPRPKPVPRTFAEEEADVLRHILAETGGNRTCAAETYGVGRRTLQYLLARYQISEPRKK